MRWFSRRTPSDSQRFAFPRTTLAAFKPPRTIISAPLPSTSPGTFRMYLRREMARKKVICASIANHDRAGV